MEKYIKETTQKGSEKMKGKYLNPKADLTFKLVFGEHPDLVMSLLNALLPLPDDGQITDVEYLTPEMVPENPFKKDSTIRIFSGTGILRSRVILNASKAVVKQLDKREDYQLIQPVYCLNLVNDIGFKSGPDEFYHDYAIVNVAHTDRIIEGLRFVFVELPKFKPKTIAEKKMAVLWLRFLTEIDEDTVEASSELLENEATRKALSIVEKSAMTEGQLYAYEKFWRAVIDEEVHFRVHYQDGFDKGMVKGREEGRAEGRAEERIKNARSLKASGIPLDVTSVSLSNLP